MKQGLVLLTFILFCAALQAQSYAGIGARIGRDSISTGWWPYISEIMEGGGASESNIISNTFISAINGVSTNNLPIDKVVGMIVGQEGTTVTLTINTAGTLTDYVITRRKIINYDQLSLITPSLIPYRSGKLWGFVNKQKELIIPLKYTNAQRFTEGLSVVELGGRHGAIDSTGKEVIPFKYATLYNAKEGRLVYEENGLYGYLDTKGKIIVAARYKSADAFSHGLAKVEGTNGYYAFIDNQGKEITPFKYDEANDFDGRLAAVELNKHYGFIDGSGKEVVALRYSTLVNLPTAANGLYQVYNGRLYGYVDGTGSEVIPCRYTSANNFRNGVAGVEADGKWILIDKTGKQVWNGTFGEIYGGASQGLVVNSDPAQKTELGYIGNIGYSSLDGKLRIPYNFDGGREFMGGYAVVNKTAYTYKIINTSGEPVNDEVYDEVKQFPNGIVLLKKGAKWAYAAQGIKTFTPYKFDYAYEFENGLAWVNFNGTDGYYIDLKGTEYYDAAGDAQVNEDKEKSKARNDVNALNLHPSDGGNRLVIDKEYAAYLTKEDEKVNLTKDGIRYMDRYVMTLKANDRVLLTIGTSDFNAVAILKSPSGKQAVYVQREKNIFNELTIDSVFNEEGDYNLFITSAQVEATGQYSVYKYIASPKALTVDENADFCTRLQLITDHAELRYAFLLSKKTGEDKSILGTVNIWEPAVQLIKDRPAEIRLGGMDHQYEVEVASATTAAGLEKKFAEYEKQIRSCAPGFDFKVTNDPAAADGVVKALNGSKGYTDKLNMNITKKEDGKFVLRIVVQ